MKIIKPLVALSLAVAASSALSWSNHTLVSNTLLSSMPAVKNAEPVKVETIESFLMATEKQLVPFLAKQEMQMRETLFHYAPRPDALAFEATGDISTVRDRFAKAIRINPNMKLPLYLQLLPGDQRETDLIAPKDVTVFKNYTYLTNVQLVQLKEGQLVAPVDVATSGNDEPDHGLDIGLFTDSNTDYGLEYGFGKQPFGNPNLEYGTQAPFHMGFYHESSVLYTLGAFLKETYPEYRITLFKQLSEFAFENGHDYWGWRFMGWGMHYIADFSNPYHITPVPGNTTLQTLYPGVMSLIGLPQVQKDATQLVSNRHTILEDFQSLVMSTAFEAHDHDHQTIQALHVSGDVKTYEDKDIIHVFAKGSYDKAEHLDAIIDQTMPGRLVSDETVEYSDLGLESKLVEVVTKESGEEGVQVLLDTISDLLNDFSSNGASYVNGIIEKEEN